MKDIVQTRKTEMDLGWTCSAMKQQLVDQKGGREDTERRRKMRRQIFNLRKGRAKEIWGHRGPRLCRTGTVGGIGERPSAFSGAGDSSDNDGEREMGEIAMWKIVLSCR